MKMSTFPSFFLTIFHVMIFPLNVDCVSDIYCDLGQFHHHHIFQVFLGFGVAGPIKSMPSGYSLDAEFNSASKELSQSKFE